MCQLIGSSAIRFISFLQSAEDLLPSPHVSFFFFHLLVEKVVEALTRGREGERERKIKEVTKGEQSVKDIKMKEMEN